MAEIKEVLVPDIGDSGEVDVVEVLVGAGDVVTKDQSIITLESDKATMDVPAPFEGKVVDVKVKAGDKIQEGGLILTVEAEAAAPASADSPEPVEGADESGRQGVEQKEAPAAEADSEKSPTESKATAPTGVEASEASASESAEHSANVDPNAFKKAYASPAVRRFARELGVDLSRVQGSGRKARILKEDVQAFVSKVMTEPGGGGASLPEVPVVDFTRFGETEKVKLSRIQRISGPRLHASWVNLPHVTQNDEADITDLEAFRKDRKAAAKEAGVSLTPLSFIMKAVVAALKEYPQINASLDPDGDHLVLKRYYHLGFAVDTPGGLVVPVIKDVDQKGVLEIAAELGEISATAREGKLKPQQIQGASFTISSLGSIGGSFFTPIINAPEVAILGVARAKMAPVWRDGEFEPRLMLPLSLSYDHRVVDGAMAVRFTTFLARVLSDIRSLVL